MGNLQPAPIQRFALTSLLLFIDNPEHASLELALDAAIPAGAAASIYDALLGRLQNLAGLFAGEKYLYYSHYPNWNDGWDINLYRKRLQIGETVSARLRQALDDAAEDGPEAICWINLLATALESSHLAAAEAALHTADLVIGASPDGQVPLLGFGAKAYSLALPAGLTAGALQAAAVAAGLRVLLMPLPASPRSLDDLAGLGITVS